jgi:hypothetical protein
MEIRKHLSVLTTKCFIISSSTLIIFTNVYFLAPVMFAQGMGSFSTAEGFIFIFMFNSTMLAFKELDSIHPEMLAK